VKALLLDGPRAGLVTDVVEPVEHIVVLAEPPSYRLSEPPFTAEAQYARYRRVALGDAGVVYAANQVDPEQAEDYANDPDLWP
jgi:hypothetical protein